MAKIYIIGICGTFMGGVAQLAKAAGFSVRGCDANVYPPMSTQLELAGIQVDCGFDAKFIDADVDCVLVGNAISRGNVMLEYILENGINYSSAPAWLYQHILRDKWVLAVAGTHGKTSTSAMLAWVLEYAGFNPSFLIGGVPQNFGVSARLTDSHFFVIEADEYDSAFSDKRSKFVHYAPRTLLINNLEFDHADIFESMQDIEWQFRQLLRTLPQSALVAYASDNPHIDHCLKRDCYSQTIDFGCDENATWQAHKTSHDYRQFNVYYQQEEVAKVNWRQLGAHNMHNAVGAMIAARHIGILPACTALALGAFLGVKRRLELLGEVAGVKVYDDFAHHPSAIASTIDGLRQHIGSARLIAVCEPRSNTMKMGVHQATLLPALAAADCAMVYMPTDYHWQLPDSPNCQVFSSYAQLLAALVEQVKAGDHVLMMSNGSFAGIHQQLLSRLADAAK